VVLQRHDQQKDTLLYHHVHDFQVGCPSASNLEEAFADQSWSEIGAATAATGHKIDSLDSAQAFVAEHCEGAAGALQGPSCIGKQESRLAQLRSSPALSAKMMQPCKACVHGCVQC
jgi:hypothetical protein